MNILALKTYQDGRTRPLELYRKIAGLSLALIFCAVFCPPALFAQEGEQMVAKVDVIGNKNISGATIIAKVRTKEGKPFSKLVASDDLKRLCPGLF